MAFDPCCGCVSLKRATICIAIFSIVYWCLVLVAAILIMKFYLKNGEFGEIVYFFLGVMIILTSVGGILFGILLSLGASSESKCLVATWLVLTIVMLFSSVFWCFIGWPAITLFAVTLVLFVSFFIIVLANYYEIPDKVQTAESLERIENRSENQGCCRPFTKSEIQYWKNQDRIKWEKERRKRGKR